jgi:hypothetical protein
MKRFLLAITIFTVVFLFIPSLTLAEQMEIYDKDWHLQYRVKDGRVYDPKWQPWGYMQGDEIYDNNWHIRYRLKNGRVYDPIWTPEGYIQPRRVYDENWQKEPKKE